MKKILLSLSLLTTLLTADNTAKTLPDDLKISLGTYIAGKHDTDLLFDNKGVSGSINVQDFLNMKTDTFSLYVGGYYRFTPNHRIELSHQGIKSAGSTDYVGKLFEGKDYEIDLNGNTNSSLQLAVTKLIYTYSYYHNDDVELGVSIGIHRTVIDLDLGASVVGNAGSFKLKIAPPIPVLGVRFGYNIFPEWDILFAYDFIGLVADLNLPDSPDIKGVSGYLTDMNLATEYRVIDNLSLGLGLNYNNLNFKLLKDDFDVGVNNSVLGMTAYASFRY